MGFLAPVHTVDTHRVYWVAWLRLVPSVIGHLVLEGVDQSAKNLCELVNPLVYMSRRAPLPRGTTSWFPSDAFSMKMFCKI